MQKGLYFFSFLAAMALCVILPGQSARMAEPTKQQLPVQLKAMLDSLRKTDNLEAWLYSYREYVYEDPSKRISVLTRAQSAAWRSCKTEVEREEWFNCLAAQGYYLLYGGNILKSIDAYEQAYRFYFEKPVAGVDILEHVLKPLGNNYTRLGDYDRALFIQGKSLSLALAGDSAQIPSICHNLATTSIWKGELSLAKKYCEMGLALVPKYSSLHGLMLSTLAEVFLKTGQKDSATISSSAAIKILSARLNNKAETSVAYWLRGAWQGLGDIHKAHARPADALTSYKKATALIDQYYAGERKREKAKLAVLSGKVLLQLLQSQKAMEQYDTALSILTPAYDPRSVLPRAKDLYAENTLLDALHGKASCLQALNKKEEALQCFILLYETGKRLRREFFSSSARQQQQKENRLWAASAIETAYDLWKTTGKKEHANKVLLFAEMSKAQLLLDEMMNNMRYNRIKNKDTLLDKEQQLQQAISFYEKEAVVHTVNGSYDSSAQAARKELEFELSLLQKKVRQKYPLQENLMTGEAVPSVDSLLQSINTGTRVVEFFMGEKDIYRVEAEKNGVTAIHKIGGAGEVHSAIAQFVETYFQSGPANMMKDPRKYHGDAFRIYQTLWPEGFGATSKNCMIIPDGILGYLPFDALVTDPVYKADAAQWQFLICKTNLYLGYSLQTQWQQQSLTYEPGPFAGFFIAFDSSRHTSIPAVKKEYDVIRKELRGDFFREEKASLAAFNAGLAKANCLHISTHSFLMGAENMPALQLADDRFFLFELYGKSFRPQLVVLSACRTGHGMLAKGEGIISLARGFMATGAGGIVAGLWDMNDETTAALVGSFYKNLHDGQSPSAALQQAKLQWLQDRTGQQFHRLPYYWAGMVYSGDDRLVEFEKETILSKRWLLVLALAGGLLIFLIKKRKLNLKGQKRPL